MRGVMGGKGVGVYRDNWNNWKGSLDWELEGCVFYIMPNMILYPPGWNFHHGFTTLCASGSILDITASH